SGEEIVRPERKLLWANGGQVGLHESGIRCAARQTRRIAHHGALRISPAFSLRDLLPQCHGCRRLCMEGQYRVDRKRTMSAECFVICIVSSRIGMPKDRKR